jgi:voltage-gated potassium channel
MSAPDTGVPAGAAEPAVSNEERRAVLGDWESWLETPMIVLAFVWLALLVVDLTRGLPEPLEVAGTIIWLIFVLDFAVRFWLSPHRGAYLRRNWLTAVSLVLPALRVFRLFAIVRVLRVARAARALQGVTRGARVVRVVGSINRGMAALRRSMARRGMGFVVLLTAVVILAGAAGMFAFERDLAAGSGFDDFWSALWWTMMLITTMGSDYWPRSPEGRVLCLLLALYAFAIFGYVTASLASFFVGRDAEQPDAEVAGSHALDALRAEVTALRRELHAMSAGMAAQPGAAPRRDSPPAV